jgi:cephalosporin-C deacetylase-like acetyl esterase
MRKKVTVTKEKNRMRVLTLFAALVLCGSVALGKEKAKDKYAITIELDRKAAVYKQGEKATFTINLLEDGQPMAEAEYICHLTVDTARTIEKKKVKYAGQPQTVSATLNEPGFLRCTVTYRPAEGKRVVAISAAGFDPLLIKPSLPVPADFKKFWDEQKAKLAEVKMDVQEMKPVLNDGKIEVFDVKIKCLGEKPVSGYFARPLKRAPKSMPVILWTHGGGVRSSNMGRAINGARKGYLSLDINAHGLPNGKPKEFYTNLNRGALAGYRKAGRTDRETIYFKWMFLRLVRALDFLTSQPEWDGKTVIVRGHSQGGTQALVAAGLDERVTAIGAGISALCEQSGMVLGRVVGWPWMVPVKNGKPDEKILQAARYYDVMNFASLIKAEVIMTVGFIDDSCKPTTVYAAYNNIKSPKQIIDMPGIGHRVILPAERTFTKFLDAHVERMKRPVAAGITP